jgi:D-psicose/D-tagatose/L-ribulose 3-epimerase
LIGHGYLPFNFSVELPTIMKFGIHSLLFSETFTDRDLPLLDKAKAMGFEAVDIVPFEVDKFPAGRVRQRAEELGLEIIIETGMPAHANIISPDPGIRAAGVELSKRLVDVSAEAGATVFGGVNYAGWGYLTGRMRTDEEWKWGVENFRQVADYAAAQAPDLTIALEVVNRFESHFLNIAADAVRFVHDLGTPANVKVHLDAFHMIREEDSFAGAVLETGPLLGYIHACENQRGIPGRGQVPWREFFQALADVNYQGVVTIESFDPNFKNIAKLCCIWRKLADSPEQLATEGLEFLKSIQV